MTPQSASFTLNTDFTMEHQPQWFVATVKPQHEAIVAQGLDLRGIEQFSPTYETSREHIRADRRILRRPLFRGYVFCRFDRQGRAEVVKTPGVTSIVGFGGIAMPVPEDELERVRTMVASQLPMQPWPFHHGGDLVRIKQGPLRGMDGIIVRCKDDYQLVVSVTFLQRSVSVTVDPQFLSPPIQYRNASSPVKYSPEDGRNYYGTYYSRQEERT